MFEVKHFVWKLKKTKALIGNITMAMTMIETSFGNE